MKPIGSRNEHAWDPNEVRSCNLVRSADGTRWFKGQDRPVPVPALVRRIRHELLRWLFG